MQAEVAELRALLERQTQLLQEANECAEGRAQETGALREQLSEMEEAQQLLQVRSKLSL